MLWPYSPLRKAEREGQHRGVGTTEFVNLEPGREISLVTFGIVAGVSVESAWSSVTTTITFGRSSVAAVAVAGPAAMVRAGK